VLVQERSSESPLAQRVMLPLEPLSELRPSLLRLVLVPGPVLRLRLRLRGPA
jgi:hypothetical protein